MAEVIPEMTISLDRFVASGSAGPLYPRLQLFENTGLDAIQLEPTALEEVGYRTSFRFRVRRRTNA